MQELDEFSAVQNIKSVKTLCHITVKNMKLSPNVIKSILSRMRYEKLARLIRISN